MNKLKRIIPFCITLIFCILMAFSVETGEKACAIIHSADYNIDGEDCSVVGGTYSYANTEHGFTVKVNIADSLFNTDIYVKYCAYKSGVYGLDLSSDEEIDEELITSEGFAKDKDENELNMVRVPDADWTITPTPDSGQNTGKKSFTVTFYENCVVRFYMYWNDTLTNEEQEAEGDFIFYTDRVDYSSPTVKDNGDYVYMDGGWNFTLTIRGNDVTDVTSANSGLKGYEFYRMYDGTNRELIKSSENDTAFKAGMANTSSTISVSIKDYGSYYLKTVDGVGNTTVSFVSTLEGGGADESIRSGAEAFIQYEGSNYLESDIARYEQAFNAYMVASADEKASKLAAYRKIAAELTSAKRNYTTKLINGEYVSAGAVTVRNYDEDALLIKKGQTVTLGLTFGLFSDVSIKQAQVEQSGIKNADAVLTINVQQTINRTDDPELSSDFSAPVLITVPLDKKYTIAKVVCYNQDTQSYVSVRADKLEDKVVIYLSAAPSELSIVLSDGEGDEDEGKNLKWLYSLFALVPLSAAAFFIVRKEKKKQTTRKKKDKKQKKHI